MRKTAIVAFGLLTAAVAWNYGQAAVTTYKATLAGAAEVPPVKSGGTGSAAVSIDTATKKVSWTVQYSGLSGPAAAAHIHCGAPAGANSGVAVSFGTSLASPFSGSGEMTDAQIADLAAGKCYVNIHTAANKGGEIRGQLMP